ncbi:MAG: flavodoxin family protein [Methanomassiliicoccaceae archaeon]|jgi:multimeric flavodoxin WrbA|nr:flavodoxin family protein [Methanomassiliicoccaceae archaeon]
MNVLFIVGSARKESITMELCKAAASSIYDAEVKFIRPHEMHIDHCTGCRKCRDGACVIDDDMSAIHDAAEKSDMIIFATPVYFSGPTSIIKQVADRFQSIWEQNGYKGTKSRTAALICVGGRDRPVFSGVIPVFKALAMTIGAAWAGELTIGGTDKMKELPDRILEEAQKFGDAVSRAHRGS